MRKTLISSHNALYSALRNNNNNNDKISRRPAQNVARSLSTQPPPCPATASTMASQIKKRQKLEFFLTRYILISDDRKAMENKRKRKIRKKSTRKGKPP